ncbi:AEX-3 domain-containing protein [Linnemannia elongata]|nr:AEX-3 domain-containing protein [Linnemannia elongata]
MATMGPSPKRMADYFFMVGLHDDFSLLDESFADHQGMGYPTELSDTHSGHHTAANTNTTPTTKSTAAIAAATGAQADRSPTAHSSISHGDTTHSVDTTTSPANSNLSSPLQAHTPVRSHARSRSKSMAQFNHIDQSLPDHYHRQNGSMEPQRNLTSEDDPTVKDVSVTMRPTSGAVHAIKRPARRSVTMSDISQQGSTGLHHRASYRHVTAGSLYKSVQEGLQQGLARERTQEGDGRQDRIVDDKNGGIHGQSEALQARAVPKRHETYPTPALTSQQYRQNATLSVYDVKGLAHGKNMAVIRSMSKLDHGVQKAHVGSSSRSVYTSPETHPAERAFNPVVTCRYPEQDWEDSEVFPPHLPMFCFPGELTLKLQAERPPTTYHSFVMTQETGNRSYAMCVIMYERMPTTMYRQFEYLCQKWTKNRLSESEMEYVKATKAKITREKSLLRTLNERLREERTLGRGSRIIQIKRDIADSEEKLSLLQDQMEPWKRMFVDAGDAWIPRCVGLVSALPYHYLLRDWLLGVVIACSGGVDHPGMSLSSLPLERYVKNIIHEVGVPPFGKMEIGITINNRMIFATRPALNSVPIVKNFSLYPLFRCLSAEDIVTVIEVMLAEGKIIFLSSHLGMLTLAAESFLYMFFPLYWQGVYIPILPAALMTCLQAPVPYIIGVERSCCDAEFPPEEACVVDLEKGTIDVQLAPMQLPARPRRKLVQSLEMYAPTSAGQRNLNSTNAAFGPPDYVKFAYPNSRLTLFCGVSRAPRMGRRSDSLRPPAPSSVSTITAASVQGSLAGVSRNSSTHTLNQPSVQNPPALPKIPKMDFEKETLLEGGLMGLEFEDVLKGEEATSLQSDFGSGEMPGRPSVPDSKVLSSKVAPEQDTTETITTATRKVLSPQRSRANVFEMPRRQESSTDQRLYVHQTGSQQDTSRISMESGPHLRTGDGSSRLLSHRASVTSIDSSNSSLWLKSSSTGLSSGAPKNGSPMSTMTSTTMGSVNGPSKGPSTIPSSSTSSLPLPAHALPRTSQAGIGFVEGSVDDEPQFGLPLRREGHVLSFVSSPVPIPMLSGRCGICAHGIASHQRVYRCEGCSLLVHGGCVEELLYPCVPRGFDESGICWSVLQMWAGILRGYRTGILSGQQYLQPFVQAQSPRNNGQAKQLSSTGSEGEKGVQERISWVSFRGWTSRSSANNSPSPAVKGPGAFSSPSNRVLGQTEPTQQPMTRARSGTNGSIQSDTVRFHREVFMKNVDKDAKVFMASFTESQAFVQFVQDRVDRSPGDPEIMFFDEVIKAKMNRSRFRLGKEETKFLDDPSYGIQGTIKAPPPVGEHETLVSEDGYKRFPASLDPAKF